MISLLSCPSSNGNAFGEPCPSYPPMAPSSKVFADPGVKWALDRAVDLLAVQAMQLPGLVGTIVYNQTTVWSGSFGRRRPDKHSDRPRSTDLVRIASITKTFTDLLAYQMRDAGLIGLDDALAAHLPHFSMPKAPGARTRGAITLRSLGAHLAGVPREAPWPCSLDEHMCNEEAVLALLNETLPVMPPYRRFHYSNLGIALLGRALAHAAGKVAGGGGLPYEALLAKRILAPLGMANATFDTAAAVAADHVAAGYHDPEGTQPVNLSQTCTPAPGAPGSWLAPCGCLWASADDLARLLKLFFRDDAPDSTGAAGEQVVDGDTLHELLSPAVLMRDGYEAIGEPWEMVYMGDAAPYWAKGKQGELPGYRSSVLLVEPLKLGVFVSALVSDVPSSTVWTLDVMRLLAPAVAAALRRLQPPPALPAADVPLVTGTYLDGSVVVAPDAANATLQLRLGPAAAPLNLTLLADASTPTRRAFRARPAHSTATCRTLDDGSDLEIATFTLPQPGARASRLRFMDGLLERVG